MKTLRQIIAHDIPNLRDGNHSSWLEWLDIKISELEKTSILIYTCGGTLWSTENSDGLLDSSGFIIGIQKLRQGVSKKDILEELEYECDFDGLYYGSTRRKNLAARIKKEGILP